jgi:hypothetical protein
VSTKPKEVVVELFVGGNNNNNNNNSSSSSSSSSSNSSRWSAGEVPVGVHDALKAMEY